VILRQLFLAKQSDIYVMYMFLVILHTLIYIYMSRYEIRFDKPRLIFSVNNFWIMLFIVDINYANRKERDGGFDEIYDTK